MAVVVVYQHAWPSGKPAELVFDTDDLAPVETVSTPRDVIDISCGEAGCGGCRAKHRRMGLAHLDLTFKEGKAPIWRDTEP